MLYLYLKELCGIYNSMAVEFVTLMYQTDKLFLVLLGLLCISDFNFDVSTRIITNLLQSFNQ